MFYKSKFRTKDKNECGNYLKSYKSFSRTVSVGTNILLKIQKKPYYWTHKNGIQN
ncbi:hypothetical protein LEP1GSC172_0376 [Leptospira noguchii]|uniref:Uncharacterized protein n=1 Tax=Leptospira noguchii TaxID=28182 RepID=M6V4J1_9LEPT|nr:hypothetical protein LEP1GSC172_0376 [Leptospira noguchii]